MFQPKKNVYKWAKLFKEGRRSVEDEDRPGRPTEVRSPEVIKSVNDLIQSNRRVTVDDIARTLSLSVGTAHKIVHDDLGYSKVSCRWVPKMLTAEHSSSNGADHQRAGLGTAPSSPLQPRPCPFRLSPVWSLESVHERHEV